MKERTAVMSYASRSTVARPSSYSGTEASKTGIKACTNAPILQGSSGCPSLNGYKCLYAPCSGGKWKISDEPRISHTDPLGATVQRR